jgi:hypothetical protein
VASAVAERVGVNRLVDQGKEMALRWGELFHEKIPGKTNQTMAIGVCRMIDKICISNKQKTNNTICTVQLDKIGM